MIEQDQDGFRPGDIYEDCAYHPVFCTHVEDDELRGVSLIDASAPRSCSLTPCDPIKLSIADVISARADWPAYLKRRQASA